jgi:catechol 2,3-dioxygenase
VKVHAIGHAVLKVRNADRAEEFYTGVLGMPVAARMPAGPLGRMTFFTLGNHHDFAVVEVGDDAPNADRRAPGLFHVAFKVGETTDELRAVKSHLEEAGVKIDAVIDHIVSESIYIRDPDGNGIELYVDASQEWREKPELVAGGTPLSL